MKVIILAAGMGTRLGRHTNEIPKCMVKIKKFPIIYFQKLILSKFNIFKNNIYIVTGYKHNKINIDNFKKIINPYYYKTNMLYSLFYKKKILSDKLIISYGDIVYSDKIINKLISSKAMISVVIDKNWRSYWNKRFKDPLSDAESLRIDQKGYIREIGSKVININQINGQYIGLIKLSKKGSELFKKHYSTHTSFNGKFYKKAYLTDFLNDLIIKGYRVKAIMVNNPWIEVDTIKDLKNPITIKRLNRILK